VTDTAYAGPAEDVPGATVPIPVPQDVPPGVPGFAPGDVPGFAPGGVPRGGEDGGGEDEGWGTDLGWIGADHWDPEPAGGSQPPDAAGGRGAGLAGWLAGSEMLGGGPGGLLDKLARPDPDSIRGHLAHVAGHPRMPAGKWAAAAFVAGHLLLTGPLKITGETLTAAGNAFIYAGERISLSGDRAASAIVVYLAAVTAIILILAFA
jgi:hypothetical protein